MTLLYHLVTEIKHVLFLVVFCAGQRSRLAIPPPISKGVTESMLSTLVRLYHNNTISHPACTLPIVAAMYMNLATSIFVIDTSYLANLEEELNITNKYTVQQRSTATAQTIHRKAECHDIIHLICAAQHVSRRVKHGIDDVY